MSLRREYALLVLTLFCVGFVPWCPAHAQNVTFTFSKLFAQGDTVPQTADVFTGFQAPSLDANQGVGFRGSTTTLNAAAFYRQPFSFAVVASQNDTIPPGGFGTFPPVTGVGPGLSVDGTDVVFWGSGVNNHQGIYTNAGGPLSRIVDKTTLAPNTNTQFGIIPTSTTSGQADGGAVAFRATPVGGSQALYSTVGGLHTIADNATPIPGGGAQFTTFIHAPALSNGVAAFIGNDTNLGRGIYRESSSVLTKIVDTNDLVPGGGGAKFENITYVAFDDGHVAFLNVNFGFPTTEDGVYTNLGGPLRAVADLSTPVPGGGSWEQFWSRHVSIHGSNILFMASTNSGDALFLECGQMNNELVRVIGEGDVLDGKVIDEISMTREALFEDRIGFWVDFTDNTSALYLATKHIIPEPTSLVLCMLGAVSGGGMFFRRQGARDC